MSTPSLTIENRRYVWAESVPKARDKIAAELRAEGVTNALMPELAVKWTGLTRPGRVDWDATTDKNPAMKATRRRYAVDIDR